MLIGGVHVKARMVKFELATFPHHAGRYNPLSKYDCRKVLVITSFLAFNFFRLPL